METTAQTMTSAIQARNEARVQFNNATTPKARREADELLNFWIGKVANLEAKARQEAV